MPYNKNIDLEQDLWVPAEQFAQIIIKGITLSFSTRTSRDNYISLFRSIMNTAAKVVAKNFRFPNNQVYINVFHPILNNLICDLMKSLNIEMRSIEKRSTTDSVDYSRLEDSRTLFYNTVFRISKEISPENLDKDNSCLETRQTYEKRKSLIWE